MSYRKIQRDRYKDPIFMKIGQNSDLRNLILTQFFTLADGKRATDTKVAQKLNTRQRDILA